MLRKIFYLAVIIGVCFYFYGQILTQVQEYVDQRAQEPWAPRVQLYIGKVYSFARDYDKAEKTFQSLKKRFPKSSYAAKAQWMIASIYETKEDYSRAKAEFEKFIKDYPTDEYAKKADDKLRIYSLFKAEQK